MVIYTYFASNKFITYISRETNSDDSQSILSEHNNILLKIIKLYVYK